MWNSIAFPSFLTGLMPALRDVWSSSSELRAHDDHSSDDLVPLIERALRAMNRPALLATCELAALIPGGTTAARAVGGDIKAAGPPLERARALRNFLSDAIARLRPADEVHILGGDDPSSLQFQILVEEYFQALPVRAIARRHALSESTVYRYRKEAIAILARDLAWQEQRLMARGMRGQTKNLDASI